MAKPYDYGMKIIGKLCDYDVKNMMAKIIYIH